MTDAEPAESRVVWIAKTLGSVALFAIVTVILTNAVQSFFFERIIPGVSTGVAVGVAVIVSGMRRKRLAQIPDAERNS
ncbi:MAG: hypothetical protein AABZ80_01240 [Gemmatimonadota bacterium]